MEEAKLRDMAASPLAKNPEKFLNMLPDIQKYMENMKLIVLNLVRSLFTEKIL